MNNKTTQLGSDLETRKEQCTQFMNQYKTTLLPQLMLHEEAELVFGKFCIPSVKIVSIEDRETSDLILKNVGTVRKNTISAITEILADNNDSPNNEVTQYMLGYFLNKFENAMRSHFEIYTIEEKIHLLKKWSGKIVPQKSGFHITNPSALN